MTSLFLLLKRLRDQNQQGSVAILITTHPFSPKISFINQLKNVSFVDEIFAK